MRNFNNMIKFKRNLVQLTFIAIAIITLSCSDDPETPTTSNPFIGTWRLNDGPTFWTQYTFSDNLTGVRSNSLGESGEFQYSFTATQITFTGARNGTVNYSVNGNKLRLIDEEYTKQ